LGVSWQLRPILDFRSILALSIGFAESRRYTIPWADRSEHHIQLDPVLARSPSQSRAIDPLVLTICKASVQIRSDRCRLKKRETNLVLARPQTVSMVERRRGLAIAWRFAWIGLAHQSSSPGHALARPDPAPCDPIAGSPSPRQSPSYSDTRNTILWRKNGKRSCLLPISAKQGRAKTLWN
jgi:hypothetical protein